METLVHFLLASFPAASSRGRSSAKPWLYSIAMVLGAALTLSAQVLSPPPQLGPTVAALDALHKCGNDIARSAPSISSDILDAQQQLFFGLAKGGYADQFNADTGGQRGGYQTNDYQRHGDWLLTPPPKQYVADLTQEAQWCLEVSNILNNQPAKVAQAKEVLASIAKDLNIKVKDCKDWGAGRLVTVVANTVKDGHPDSGWTVMYKWVSVSGLNSRELAFPQVSSPTSQGVPPGVYSVYATKQVGNSVVKTQPIAVSAFQQQKVKCEIPVP
jgi:hypothetical protein